MAEGAPAARFAAAASCAFLWFVLVACDTLGGDSPPPEGPIDDSGQSAAPCAESLPAVAALPPLPPPERSIEVSGKKLESLTAGPPDGEVLLLLQGFPYGSYDYRAALPRLGGAGYRAIAAVERRAQAGAPEEQRSVHDRALQALELVDAPCLNKD